MTAFFRISLSFPEHLLSGESPSDGYVNEASATQTLLGLMLSFHLSRMFANLCRLLYHVVSNSDTNLYKLIQHAYRMIHFTGSGNFCISLLLPGVGPIEDKDSSRHYSLFTVFGRKSHECQKGLTTIDFCSCD